MATVEFFCPQGDGIGSSFWVPVCLLRFPRRSSPGGWLWPFVALGLQSWRTLISQPPLLGRPWQALCGSLTYFELLCGFPHVKKASSLSIFKQTRSVASPCLNPVDLLLDPRFRVCFCCPVATPSSPPSSPHALRDAGGGSLVCEWVSQ